MTIWANGCMDVPWAFCVDFQAVLQLDAKLAIQLLQSPLPPNPSLMYFAHKKERKWAYTRQY